MNKKSITNNQSHVPPTKSHYCTEPDEVRETFSQSSFVQVQSIIQSSQDNSDQPEQKTRLRTSSPTKQTKSKLIVQNLCNQIKYLIEGNLKNDQLNIEMSDIVRDNIIPMLIKMFFQQSVDKKSGFFGSKQMSSTYQSKNRDKSEKGFMSQEWQIFSAQSFKHNNLSKVNKNLSPKSLYISMKPDKEIQVINGQQFFVEEQQSGQIQESIQRNNVPKLLFLTIVLMKLQVIKKTYCFQKLKQFSHTKQKLIKQFINIFHIHRIKYCLHKFKQNHYKVQKEINQQKITLQIQIFKQKTSSISCQIIAKIIKQKIYKYFVLFKLNNLKENKWIKQWVRIAALKSPLTLKTSVWRLKNFLSNQQKPTFNKKSKKQYETSIKQIIITQDTQIQNKPSPLQVSKKLIKKSQGNITQKQSSQQSITSAQFDAMFQNQSQQEIIESEKSMKKTDKVTDDLWDDRVQEKEKQQQFQQDGYLNTISQDENQLSSICE